MKPTFNEGRLERKRLYYCIQDGFLRIRKTSKFCPRWRYDSPLSRKEKKLYRKCLRTLNGKDSSYILKMVDHVRKWQRPLYLGLLKSRRNLEYELLRRKELMGDRHG